MDISPQGLTRTEKKQAQIRTAAKELFLRSGFQGTSTDAIAAAAGVSKETLYRYYAKKEDLFVDVVRSLTTERLHLEQWIERSTEPTSQQELRMLLLAREHLDLPLIGRMFFSTLLSYGVPDGLLSNPPASHMPEADVIETFVEQIMKMVSAKSNE